MSVEAHKPLLALLDEAALLVTSSGTLLVANPTLAGLLALPAEQLQGRTLDEFTTTANSTLLAYLRACSRTTRPVTGTVTLQTPNGERAFTAKGAVLQPRQGNIEATILLRLLPKLEANHHFRALKERIDQLNREILARRRIEHDLHSQKQWLQVTLTSIGDAVITADMNGKTTFLNPVAEELTGWTGADAIGRPIGEVFVVVNEYTRRPVVSPVDIVLREKRVVDLANHSVLIARSGREIPVEDTAAPIGLDDTLEGVVLIFHDVSAKRDLQKQLFERAERLEVANRRQSEFLVMLAHELRNPLAPISNAIQILERHTDRSELTHQAHAIIARQVRHMTRLVDDMLDVSRITRGKVRIDCEMVDLAALARTVCSDLDAQFVEAGIELELTAPDSAVWLEADPTRITQVLDNLLGNAKKFTPRGGRVAVTISTRGAQATLAVTDSGIGIDEALMPELFEPFTQAAQSLDRSSGGLGLGLSLVKGIVDLHNGDISAESSGEGQGATFTMRLPLADGRRHGSGLTDKPASNKAFRILLVEDNPDTATTMRTLLEMLGNQVYVANTGPEGLEKATNLLPDVVICDIGLPGLDGFSVAKELRGNPNTASMCLIALTGYSQNAFAERARQAGFDYHFVKPVTIEVIQEVIGLLDPA